MRTKYVVRLTAKERQILREVIAKLTGSSQKVRRAQMLLKADETGPPCTAHDQRHPLDGEDCAACHVSETALETSSTSAGSRSYWWKRSNALLIAATISASLSSSGRIMSFWDNQ